MKKIDTLFFYIALALVAASIIVCGIERLVPPPANTPTATRPATSSPTATHTPTVAKIISAPTFTPTPTATPWPTATKPHPTAINTPPVTVTAITLETGCLIHPGTIYTVRPGDTLWRVADCAYGQPWRWPTIYNANPQLSNPHLIHANNRLIIPHDRRDRWPDQP